MKKLIKLFIFLMILGHYQFAMADNITSCSRHDNQRIITLDYLLEDSLVPCQVIYEKPTERPGYRKILWQAKNSAGYCERKMDAFIQKLERYGWQCTSQKTEERPASLPKKREPRPLYSPPVEKKQFLRQKEDGLATCNKGNAKRILILDYLVKGSLLPCQVIYEKPVEKSRLS
jgi:hypothetical protein